MGAKINFAFIAIILVMAITQVGFALFIEFSKSRSKAQAVLEPAIKCANTEVINLYKKQYEIACLIDQSGEFKRAIAAKDKAAVAAEIKRVFDAKGFDGYGTVVLESGPVLYSSDSNKSGFTPNPQMNMPILNKAFGLGSSQNGFAYALTILTNTGTTTLSSLIPINVNGKVPAILAVSTPFAANLLQGMERKIQLTNDNLKDIDMVFFGMLGAGVTACSTDLQGAKPPPNYLAELNKARNDPFGNTIKNTEADGRMWRNLPIMGPDNKNPMGQIIICTPLQNPLQNLTVLLMQLGIAAAVAFLLSCLFASGLNSRFAASMRFLKKRAKDLADNRHDLPSLAVLGGDWLELAEMMDTAMASPRTLVLSLKQQVSQQEEELVEKQRQVDAINNQLEMVNRQLTAHNRSALEVGNQVQAANRQAVQVQQKLDVVMQCSSEGFLLLDPYGSVLAANPTFLRWMGVEERDIFGKVCFDIVKKPGEPRELQTLSFANPAGNPNDLISQFYPEGIVYHRFENKQTEVLMHLQPVVNEEGIILGYIMVLRDKSLHAEVARLRSEIVTMLGQDIRGPLASAESHWKSILAPQQLQGVAPATAQNLLEMHKLYEQMMGMVDSYLMMYGGFVPPPVEQIQREQVSVTRLIGECLEHVSQNARAQQIMLDYKTVTGLPTTAINKEIVRDIIINLLEKMIVVTAPGGRVRAETTIKGKEIRLIISSSGPALQQVEIEEMFIGFIGGKHAEDTYQTRLNMYLARNNAERLGGRIWAESEAGRGTAIFLTLPVH